MLILNDVIHKLFKSQNVTKPYGFISMGLSVCIQPDRPKGSREDDQSWYIICKFYGNVGNGLMR